MTLACLALGLSFLPNPSGVLAANPLLKRFEYSLPRMGTMFRIEMYSADSAQASKAAEAAFARAEELEQIMSDYRADSELDALVARGRHRAVPGEQRPLRRAGEIPLDLGTFPRRF